MCAIIIPVVIINPRNTFLFHIGKNKKNKYNNEKYNIVFEFLRLTLMQTVQALQNKFVEASLQYDASKDEAVDYLAKILNFNSPAANIQF